jgi:catechol 2,3-dioxygenase-like lactoylglutathione lyase family enzyme
VTGAASSAGTHRITHLGLCVSDLERSLGFYRDALGFVERDRLHVDGPETATLLGVPDVVLDLVYLERDGLRIELLAYAAGATGDGSPRPMDRLGLTHLSVRVDDLDGLAASITAHGGRVLGGTETTFATGNRGLMAVDPDGTRLELIERRRAG